jgi:hypothetical protein
MKKKDLAELLAFYLTGLAYATYAKVTPMHDVEVEFRSGAKFRINITDLSPTVTPLRKAA